MYDPLETELSFDYLKRIVEKCKNKKIRFAILGGWAVFFYVNEEYRRAFGVDYIKSRDIDIFVDAKDENKFNSVIKELGFEKGEYHFRYKLVYDRENKKLLSIEEAKKKHLYNLINIFLDVFSNKKTKIIGSWVLDVFKKIKVKEVDSISVIGLNSLLKSKCISFFEREKLDKEFKDACDLYVLLIYAKGFEMSDEIKKAIKKISDREDLCEFIAENVLRDSLKSSIVKISLRNLV